MPHIACCSVLACLIWATLGDGVRAAPVSFEREVMAILSKAGCNQGVCHGNQNGKNGFKLSLRGQDPAWDYAALTRDAMGRRTKSLHPDESLLIMKTTGRTPHEGGRRFAVDSLEYSILVRWLAEGMSNDAAGAPHLKMIEATPMQAILYAPVNLQPIRVRARFSDGQVQDVTRLAVFESSNPAVVVTPDGIAKPERGSEVVETAVLVRYLDKQAVVKLAFVPDRPGLAWKKVPAATYFDRHVFAKLRTLRIQPSELCSDAVFLRRAFLDALGVLPTADEARVFLNDTQPSKRPRLINHLLQRPEFADFWALKWSDLLRNEEKALDRKGVQIFHHWIRQCIADGKPLNEFARELVAARGSTYSHPPANFYRALREPTIRAETVGQVFLGVRLQCARCHNHPFDRWTQGDYYGLSAFFPRIDYVVVENRRQDGLDKHEFDGEQIVVTPRQGELRHPSTKEIVLPRLLGASGTAANPEADRLLALADWIADSNNPFFARTQVNRIWYHLLGRGIVEPIDDFRVSNPAVNEPLLEALTLDFAEHRFDLRHVVRTIMNSRTYQLSARPNETNRADELNFSHALVRPLQAEQLLDAIGQVTGSAVKHSGYPESVRAGQIPAVSFFRQRDRRATAGEEFLKVFGKPERLLSCECERSEDTTLARAFQLISGAVMNRVLTKEDNRLGQMLGEGKATLDIVQEFYLAALSRPPAEGELRTAVDYLEKAKDRRAALEDVLWGLLNAKEFLLRQ